MLTRENLAVAIVHNVLPASLHPHSQGGRVRVEIADKALWLLPVWVGEGFPADVRRGLQEYRESGSSDIPVITGRKISKGSRQLLEIERASWADADGYAEIYATPGIHISRLEHARRVSEKTMTWSPSVAATAEVILQRQWRRGPSEDGLRVERATRVSDFTGLSYAQTSKILSTFDEQGYTTKVGPERGPTATREFRDPGRLLSDWAGYYTRTSGPGAAIQFHVPWRSSDRSLEAVHAAMGDTKWAISGTAAAARISPYLTELPDVMLYVNRDQIEHARQSLANNEDITEVETGGRIHLYAANPYLLTLSNALGYYWIAPAVRVYGDLLRLRGRAGEAADFLRETTLGI
jgi:hypothetical protein